MSSVRITYWSHGWRVPHGVMVRAFRISDTEVPLFWEAPFKDGVLSADKRTQTKPQQVEPGYAVRGAIPSYRATFDHGENVPCRFTLAS